MSTSRKSPAAHLLNVVRGALIGTAEVVPGISGGTVALITGVYESLITSAGHVLSGIKALVGDAPRGRGTARARAEFAQADWAVIIAVLVGMVVAVLTAARILAPWVEENPQQAFAVFFGLVLASLWVPYSLSGGNWRPVHYLLAGGAAVLAFVLTGLPPAEVEPTAPIVMGAGAIAICALVLPGMSGSFILLTFGLYTATMNALNERDLGYIATFGAGAVIGLVFFVKLLQWLLEHHHKVTLVVMTGLLAGSLRALWPWQDEDRTPLAPTTEVASTTALAAAGFAVIVVILILERVLRGRADSQAAEHAEGWRS
jgi:putative membrane protein